MAILAETMPRQLFVLRSNQSRCGSFAATGAGSAFGATLSSERGLANDRKLPDWVLAAVGGDGLHGATFQTFAEPPWVGSSRPNLVTQLSRREWLFLPHLRHSPTAARPSQVDGNRL
jgi:hypothetical protein